MSIKKSAISEKQQELENLRWNFKQYILNNKLMNDLPKLVVDQIYSLSHNLNVCDFTNDKFRVLEGDVNSEEYVKQLVFKATKISNWTVSKENISAESVKYFNNHFAVSFNEKDIVEYSFYRDIYSKRDINSVVLVVFPQYYYVKFQVMSDEIGVSELLDENELTNLLQKEFS